MSTHEPPEPVLPGFERIAFAADHELLLAWLRDHDAAPEHTNHDD